jgi:hypothetical protein
MMLLPGNTYALFWQSANGQAYTVEAASNLVPVISWTPVATNIPATGPLTGWTGQVDQASEFLRVRVQP